VAVAFDAKSAMVAVVNVSLGTANNFMTVGASATVLIVGFEVDTSTPGTLSVTWDEGGTNQVMTQIGSTLTITGGNAPASLSLWGVVNPITGLKAIGFASTGAAGTSPVYICGVSFTGSATSSVAAATEGNASNNATSSSFSVTTSTSIRATDMAMAFAIDCGSGFSNTTTENLGGTQIGENQTQTNNACGAYFTGAGATVNAHATLAASDVWGGLIVGVAVPAATTRGGTLPMMGVGHHRSHFLMPKRCLFAPTKRRIILPSFRKAA
jgi:hypothetical protein